MVSLIFIFLIGITVALIRRHYLVPVQEQPPGDPPSRLLTWAADLQSTDHGPVDSPRAGRAGRWRFALGRVAATAVRPFAKGAVALLLIAVCGVALFAYARVHYRLPTDGWTWVGVALLLVMLGGYVLGGNVLLRRPGVAVPGLAGGALLIVTWLTVSGITFYRWLNVHGSAFWPAIALAPILIGAGTAWWTGSPATARRAVRLATSTAALTIYAYGTLAVSVNGTAGHDPSDGWTVAQIVADDMGNQVVFYLIALPLATATIGWAAAAATARLRAGRTTRPPRPALIALLTTATLLALAAAALTLLRA